MKVPVAPHACQHLVILVFQILATVIDRWLVVSHCCFILHFPDDIGGGASFHMLTCHLYIFLGEVSVKVYGSFFNWVVHFLNAEFLEFFVSFR